MKVATCIPLTPRLQAIILNNVATKTNVSFQYITLSDKYEGAVHITSNCVIIEYDGIENEVICSQGWITVMRALNNISTRTRGVILQIIEKYPKKLLLVIEVILSIQCCDIIFVILELLFNKLQHEDVYDVYTYVNNNGTVEPTLCYRKLCGFEHNKYVMSEYLINYFDMTYDMWDYDSECEKADEMLGDNWIIDPKQQLFLLEISRNDKKITVGKVSGIECSIFVYAI